MTLLSVEKLSNRGKNRGGWTELVVEEEEEEEEAEEGNLRSGRHLRVIGKRIPRDSPPSSFGVAHPRRELPRDSSHPDGSVWGARPSYHRHALGECHPSVPWPFFAYWPCTHHGTIEWGPLSRWASILALSILSSLLLHSRNLTLTRPTREQAFFSPNFQQR